jgi:NAD-dependent dihydropyrimidine dehydrogenase PreA subunit
MMLEVAIDKSKCTLCGLCIDACPVSCLVFDASESVVLPSGLEECLVCRSCEDHCPADCLEILFPEWQNRSSIRSGHIVTELPAVSDLFKQGHQSIAKECESLRASTSAPPAAAG